MPGALTPWTLRHRDLFDRETPASVEARGIGILSGLRQLWRHTLTEGVDDKGNQTFASFSLAWGDAIEAQADAGVGPFANTAVVKLQGWAKNIGKSALVSRIAERHLQLLQTSSRWTAASLNPGDEGRQLLKEVDAMTGPGQLSRS